jgi:hypothetical protein
MARYGTWIQDLNNKKALFCPVLSPIRSAPAPPSRRGFGLNTPEVIRGCCKSAVRKRGAGPRTRNPRPAKAGEVEQFEKIADAHFSREIGQSSKRLTTMSDQCWHLAMHKPLRLDSGADTSPGGVYVCKALLYNSLDSLANRGRCGRDLPDWEGPTRKYIARRWRTVHCRQPEQGVYFFKVARETLGEGQLLNLSILHMQRNRQR